MRTIAGWLLAGFALVIAVMAGLTTLLVGVTTPGQIRQVMLVDPSGTMEMTDIGGLRDRVEASYRREGTWDEAQGLLAESAPHLEMMGRRVILADADYNVVSGSQSGSLEPALRGDALPLMVAGTPVGYLWVEGGGTFDHVTVMAVADRVNRAVWLAATAAGVAAFALAVVIVRTVSAPLARTALAAQAVARGDLTARAPDAGPEEVRSVGAAFNSMAASLQRQEQMKRALLADIAHELRTPLTVMQGQLEALMDEVFEPTPGNLAPLHAQALDLARLVDDLGTLANADAGALTLERSRVDLRDEVASMLAAARADATEKELRLANDVPRGLPLDADPVRLRQVLGNLLANAIRHTPPGGSVSVAARSADVHAVIEVTDTGPGISPRHLAHVFERFYRAESSRSRATGGSGLGLAIARQLTEAHGGTIRAASTLGRGTTITLTWPMGSG